MITFQNLISRLQAFWAEQGCAILQPYDMEVGAGTFHPHTFLRAIGPAPWSAAYVQGCRRPTDGRYGENPNRGQFYYQFQVILKPSPLNIQALYLDSLRVLGIDPLIEDIRFVEDNWESPTLGAWGLGWEVWQNGMEISQFTYFQQAGGIPCEPVTGELTYGLERIALHLQGKKSFADIIWHQTPEKTLTYGELFQENERQQSHYNFEEAAVSDLFAQFLAAEKQCLHLLEKNYYLPAYDRVLNASHLFNLLDARQAISTTERQELILHIRRLSQQVAAQVLKNKESLI